MINGALINGAAINGSSSSAAVAPATEVVRGVGYRWRLRLLVDGVDLTAQLVGGGDVDREEGAAGVSGFELYLPPGPVVPTDWIGKSVAIDFISTAAGITTEARWFSGQIIRPAWNPLTRLLACECGDQLQQRVEALDLAAVDALTGGYWSEDIFEPVEGRSHWDYALERLSTRPVSLDASPLGDLRVTSWYASAPHFRFASGTTLDRSLGLDLATLGDITNRVEIEVSYRYSRLWQRNQQYSWAHPQAEGVTGIEGFCNWQTGGAAETPTIEMVEEAAAKSGQAVINADYYRVPLTSVGGQNAGAYCAPQFAWVNAFDTLLLGGSWTGARRWVQAVTETYSLTLATAAGEVEATRIVQRDRHAFEVEDDDATEAWVDEPITGGVSGASDLDNEGRRTAAITTALRLAHVEIIGGHRQTSVSWDVPAPLAMGVDLIHTLEIEDSGVRARGKCRRIRHRWDLLDGSAVSTLTIAVMRGGGANDPLTAPARLGLNPVGTPDSGQGLNLPSQLGYAGAPPYDDALLGFAGNWSAGGGDDPYPRRLRPPTDEIPASERDENVLTLEQLYRVGIPNDLLEL